MKNLIKKTLPLITIVILGLFFSGCNPDLTNPVKGGRVSIVINTPSSISDLSLIGDNLLSKKLTHKLGKRVPSSIAKTDSVVIPLVDEVKMLVLDMTQWANDTAFINAWSNSEQYGLIDTAMMSRMERDSLDIFDIENIGLRSYTGSYYKYAGEYSFSISNRIADGEIYLNPGLNYIFYTFRSNGKTYQSGLYGAFNEMFVMISETQDNTLTIGQARPKPFKMVSVTGGTFAMGSSNGTTDELPIHQVTLSNFSISQTEITQEQWLAVMGTNPSGFVTQGVITAPVEQVSWYEGIDFCNKLSRSQGKTPCYSINGNTSPNSWTVGTVSCDFTAKGYRLPTEAEWEYAARGGNKSQGYIYSGSNTLSSVGWYNYATNTTQAVGGKTPNELGLYDMSGNVWEWCWDWYGSYTSESQTNPAGAEVGTYKVARGSSWDGYGGDGRSTDRYSMTITTKYNCGGIRVVCTE